MYRKIFPFSKKNGIDNLIKTLDLVEVLLQGRELLSFHKKQFDALLSNMVSKWKTEEVKEVLNHLTL